MNEKRSSIVGFALIGVILLLFSWYNTKQMEKRQQEDVRVRDSIAAVTALQQESAADTSATQVEAPVEDVSESYAEGWLSEASQSATEYYTLENDKVRIRISSKGAQPYEVLIKDYYTYDSSALVLVRPDKSLFDLELNTNQWLNTSDLNFSPVASTDSTLTLRLQFDDASRVDAV